MTPEEFRAALKDLGVKQVFFVAGADLSPTTVSRWAKGLQPIPGWVEWVIQLLRENRTNRARLAAFGIPPAGRPAIRLLEEDTPAGQC